jgi:hypothetical protein
MSFHRIVFIGLIAAAGGVAAPAQTKAPSGATPSGAASAPSANDCLRPHDHGMERGTGPTVPNPCMPAAAASAAKVKKNHDHAKVHK